MRPRSAPSAGQNDVDMTGPSLRLPPGMALLVIVSVSAVLWIGLAILAMAVF